MAVFTDIDTHSVETLLAHYAIGQLVSYHGIAEGVENSNFLLKTTHNTFILTLFERRVEAGDLPYFIYLMTHFSGRGIACPVPIVNKNGVALQTVCGKPALIVSFLEGCSVLRPNAKQCGALGEFLAAFHLSGLDFKGHRNNTMALPVVEKLLLPLISQSAVISPVLPDIITQELHFLKENLPNNLPKGIIHADAFPDNVFFQGDVLAGIIDFYFACNDMLVLDVAICLNAWCFEKDGSFNITKAQHLLNGYTQTRSLSALERNALPVLARFAALRFLATRLHDAIHPALNAIVRPKNPLEYLHILQFQQQITSLKQYGFYD